MTSRSALCPALIGRDAEIAELERNASARRATFIVGPPGIGKTRLANMAAGIARELGYHVLSGSCTLEQSLPYAPFVRSLRRSIRVLDPAAVATLFSGGASLAAALVPDLAAVPLSDMPPQVELFAAVWELLRRLGGDEGALLLLEDLHWSDADTAALLGYLVRESDDLPIWLVGTYRGDEVHRRHVLAPVLADLARDRRFDELALRPLVRDELRAMISAIFEDSPVGDEFLDAMQDRTLGNPFFVEELLKALIEQGDLFEGVSGWERREVAEIEMPQSVREALLTRIRSLSPDASQLLHLGALQGQRIDLAVLAEASRVDAERVDEVVAEGIRLQLLADLPDPSGAYCVFRHALTREALSDDLVGPERRRDHLRIAQAIETVHESSLEVHAAELADHFLAGGDLHKAIEWGWRAASIAAASFAYDDAARRYERVLSVMSHDEPRRIEVLLEAATATTESPQANAAAAFAAEARQLAHERGDRVREAQALRLLSFHASGRGDTQGSVEHLTGALELVRGTGDEVEGLVLASLCRQLTRADRVDEATKLLPSAIELAVRTANRKALSSLRVTAMMNAPTDEELEANLAEADAAARGDGDELDESRLTETAGYIYLWRGGLDRSASLFERSIELCRRVRPKELYPRAGFAWLESLRGRYASAREHASAARTSAGYNDQLVALTALAEVCSRQASADEDEVFTELERIGLASQDTQRSVPALAAHLRRALWTADTRESAAGFWAALELTTAARGRGSHWLFSPDLACVLLAEEHHEELARWATAIDAVTGRDPHAHNRSANAWVQGTLATAREDVERAAALYEEAEAAYASMPCPARRAEVVLSHADLLSRHGAGANAAELALKALEISTTIDADRLVEQAGAALQRVSTSVGTFTFLFTDIVGSTARLAELGDAGWRSVRERHNALTRRELARFGGREVQTTGDGFFATFDAPSQALQCARAARDAVRAIGVEIRAGLHTGECQIVDGKLLGFAVHLAARVCTEAGPSEIVVTSTVREMTVGSDFAYLDLGERELKGIPSPWHLFALTG